MPPASLMLALLSLQPALASEAPQPPTAPPPGLAWVRVDAGSFSRGVPAGAPQVVTVPAFDLVRTEVTVAQYAACVEAGACSPAHTDDGRCWVHDGQTWSPGTLPAAWRAPTQPVTCVSWTQARTFAEWAGGRLPTEAEWERAARGSAGKAFAGTDQAEQICTVANLADATAAQRVPQWTTVACTDGQHGPAPVGSYRANDLGLHDLSGNVAEWVEDRWHPSYEGAPLDGSARLDPSKGRVTRGGAWSEGIEAVRVDARFWDEPELAYDNLGFRIARDAEPSSPAPPQGEPSGSR